MTDDHIREIVRGMLTDPLTLPDEFRSWMPRHLEIDPPTLPVAQLTGFAQFTAVAATPIITSETVTSTVYADAATVGPILTSLADGNYILIYGASMSPSVAAATDIMLSPSLNGGTPSDNDACVTQQATAIEFVPGARATIARLASGSNTVKIQYRQSNALAGGVYAWRWLIALKYSNL